MSEKTDLLERLSDLERRINEFGERHGAGTQGDGLDKLRESIDQLNETIQKNKPKELTITDKRFERKKRRGGTFVSY